MIADGVGRAVAFAVVPGQAHELPTAQAPVVCPAWIYRNRNLVERLWARLKEWRAVATRYEKTARSFLRVLCLAATADWIKSHEP